MGSIVDVANGNIVTAANNGAGANDKDLILKDFTDIYLKLDNSKDNKYTYDGINNPLLSNKIRSRVDRAYSKNVKISSFDLEKEFIISDHYGVKVNI